jgi:hypothetical protein
MTTETIVILSGAGVALLAILMLRLGKRLAIGLLILGGLVVAGTVALSMLGQATATREAAEAAKIAATGQAMTGAAMSLTLFVVVLLLLLLVVIVGAALAVGYFWLRWRLSESQRQGREVLRLPYHRRPLRPSTPPPVWWQGGPPVVYYVDDHGQEIDLPVDPSEWGWYE